MSTARVTSVSVRDAAKHAAERLLVSSGTAALARQRRRGDILILAYHNVVPDEAPPLGDCSLHLPRRDFAAQLDTLLETHDVISLAAALELARMGGTTGRRRPVAVITFDDAYRGALTLGVAELRARGLEATVFVAPGFLGDRAFWWDEIAWPVDTREGDAFRATAIGVCGGDGTKVAIAAARRGYGTRELPAHARCVSEEELRTVTAKGDITPASHSWSHPNLASLDGERLRTELARPKAWLADRFPNALSCIAYPYDCWSPAVAQAAREAGYLAGLRLAGGWLSPRGPSDPFHVTRFNVPRGISREGFVLRASGILCR